MPRTLLSHPQTSKVILQVQATNESNATSFGWPKAFYRYCIVSFRYSWKLPSLIFFPLRNTNMWGRFDDTIPLLYLAELLCDALADGNEDDPSAQDLNDQLAVLYRTIIMSVGFELCIPMTQKGPY